MCCYNLTFYAVSHSLCAGSTLAICSDISGNSKATTDADHCYAKVKKTFPRIFKHENYADNLYRFITGLFSFDNLHNNIFENLSL